MIPDSCAARVGKTASMTLGTGPVGFAAGVMTRDMRAECSTCRKVFGRSTYSYKLQEKIQRLVDSGEVVLRSYTPPPIPEYDPNERHAPTPAIIKAEKRVADEGVAGPVAWSLIFSAIAWGVVYEGFADKAWSLDVGHIAAIVFVIAVASLLTWWCVNCAKTWAKASAK